MAVEKAERAVIMGLFERFVIHHKVTSCADFDRI